MSRVLVTWGSARGGTEGIARIIGETLQEAGFEVELLPASRAAEAGDFDAAIIGGALYANRWHADARRFVRRRARTLQRVPVWFFSSGPLDDSADHHAIEPVRQVRALMERVGAQGHVTFGGRLAPDARGFVASAMAKKSSGDWRNEARIRAWAREIGSALPTAAPRTIIAPRGSSFDRLALHAFAGWAVCAALMATMLAVASVPTALAVHALLVPVVFAVIAARYFAPIGAREPLPVAAAFTAIVALLDLVIIAGLVQRSLAMFGSVVGFWLPLATIFFVTWATGAVRAMGPARPAHR